LRCLCLADLVGSSGVCSGRNQQKKKKQRGREQRGEKQQ
jgi:hypothetical protein